MSIIKEQTVIGGFILLYSQFKILSIRLWCNMDYSMSELINSRGFLICHVCGKEFKPNDDTKYITAGGYTCSWKCFLVNVKKIEEEKQKNKK